ncbi:MAG: hypothetical protein KDJ38_04265 [Gammaproteobacteria bacterium]|nr:hypothetical protein [Gammaproteobacteria bacterium]
MIDFDELHAQNHKITELSNVLGNLIHDRAVCDNPITSELFMRYIRTVKNHFELEDRSLYAKLLSHEDSAVKNTASLFLSGSSEIRRLFDSYCRRWCKKDTVQIGDYEKFLLETDGMFELVLNRIQDETEQLYPLVKKVHEQLEAA